jgi:NAD(P)-dependent dehydrogenase (short-subunit alcohol dehydrogenase family)
MKWAKQNNTAVISGGASGIGLEIGKRLLALKMNLAIIDVNISEGAKKTLNEASDSKNKILIYQGDVQDIDELENFHSLVKQQFGNVHYLMGNAGVIAMGTKPWEGRRELQNILNINFMGVVNICNVFIPSMLKHGERGIVVNTASKQGITRPPGNYAYNLSKTGVVAYTEAISHAFINEEDCKLKSYLLIPAFVYTPMISAFITDKPEFAATTEETVDYFFDALNRDEFYILCPDNETSRTIDEKRIQWSTDDIIKNRPAMSRWHPDYKDEFEDYMKD